MKYWWTLGCFPSGLEVPFRLKEFLTTYQRQHVPLEVEEWLQCFVRDPFEILSEATAELLSCVEQFPEIEETRGYGAIEHSVTPLLKPLEKMGAQLGIRVPPSGVRAVLNDKILRERLLDDLSDYKQALTVSGSTPHRRLSRTYLEEPTQLVDYAGTADKPDLPSVSSELGEQIGAIASPPPYTAKDEQKLIHLLTTFAEGCVAKKHYDDAFSLLSSTLLLAHDDETQSEVHANTAVAALLNGQFKEAEYHGREAALLQPLALKNRSSPAKGYALWAAAVAYQDDFDRADGILVDALALFPDSTQLRGLKENVASLKASDKRDTQSSLKITRSHSHSQQLRGIQRGNGVNFDNEFDWVRFKNRLYPHKMDPTTNEMGSVFRRVGDLGGAVSTSRSMEPL